MVNIMKNLANFDIIRNVYPAFGPVSLLYATVCKFMFNHEEKSGISGKGNCCKTHIIIKHNIILFLFILFLLYLNRPWIETTGPVILLHCQERVYGFGNCFCLKLYMYIFLEGGGGKGGVICHCWGHGA